MSAKKRTKQKSPTSHKSFLIVLAAVAVVLVIATVYLLTKQAMQTREDQRTLQEQRVRLDAAEADMRQIAEEIIANTGGVEVYEKTIAKDCGESSEKYGRGVFTCGPYFVVMLRSLSIEELTPYEGKLKSAIEKITDFTVNRSPYVTSETRASYRLYSLAAEYKDSETNSCQFGSEIYSQQQFDSEYNYREKYADGKNVVVIHGSCRETVKEPIYPLDD